MADLIITKQYEITLDSGKVVKLDAGTSVSNVGEVMDREVLVPTASEITLVLVGAARAAGQLTDIKFFVVKNLDTVNTVRIRVEDTSGHTYDELLEPGASKDIFNTNLSVSETGAAFSSYSTVDTISAQANVADVSVSIVAGEAC